MVLVCAPARRTNGPAAMAAAAVAVNLRREIMLPPCWSCRACDRGRVAPYVHWRYSIRCRCRWHGEQPKRSPTHVNRGAQGFPDGRQAVVAVTERSPPGGVWCATLTPLEADGRPDHARLAAHTQRLFAA